MMLLLPTPTPTRRSELEKEIEIERDWVRGRADFSHMWTPREVLLRRPVVRCSRIRRCCVCALLGPGLGTAGSCIIQQNSEWLFFMGLFISFDHLFQVVRCAPPLYLSLSPHSLSLLLLLLFCSFHYFYTVSSCLRSKWFRESSTVTQKSSSNGPAVSRGHTRHLRHVRCLLNQKLRTFDQPTNQPHMTAPPPITASSHPLPLHTRQKPIRIPLWKVAAVALATHHLILFYVLKVANKKKKKKEERSK